MWTNTNNTNAIDWSETAAGAFDVASAEFIVVTADAADLAAYGPVAAMLQRMRSTLHIDFAYIAECAGGDPVVRCCRPDETSGFDALHAQYGRQLLEGNSASVAQWNFHAAAVVTPDGAMHGTLCCRLRAGTTPCPGARAVQLVARLIAHWLADARLSPTAPALH